MMKVKKAIALATLLAMFGASMNVNAEETVGGCGYEECRQAPSLAPAIALGTIAVVAIVAVAVQNRGSSGHSH